LHFKRDSISLLSQGRHRGCVSRAR
jgi:hypothetical protein